jgi:lipopolysaccharide/colanic/teichoic acid biosynthesis glycosyltransferase
METLRDTKPSIFIATPESDPASIATDGVSKHDTNSHRNGVQSVVIGSNDKTRNETNALVGDPAAATVRFGILFTDPSFPTKNVPYSIVKRFFDLVIAFAILIPFSPIMIIAAVLVKLTSKGPIIFRQVRVGRGGRYFWCYKFRSMCADAEAKKQTLMHLNEASGPVFKIKRDPRITPVGAVLRKFSIDELPQLFNVIKGDMSIVGPRPPLPSEVALYTAHDRGRLAVRPGLTCTWQVGGRSNVSFDRWVELDLEYIATMSFVNDVKLVLKTIPAVLKGSGAH